MLSSPPHQMTVMLKMRSTEHPEHLAGGSVWLVSSPMCRGHCDLCDKVTKNTHINMSNTKQFVKQIVSEFHQRPSSEVHDGKMHNIEREYFIVQSIKPVSTDTICTMSFRPKEVINEKALECEHRVSLSFLKRIVIVLRFKCVLFCCHLIACSYGEV